MIIKFPFFLCIAAVVMFGRASAVEYTNATTAGKRVTVCRIDIHKERLQLFLRDDTGLTFKSFDAINRWLQPRGEKLIFGMNAGMYNPEFAPVGLFVSDGQELAPLNTSNGTGNFFLKPNGVFLLSDKGARIVESSEYPALGERILLATQSGPLLVRAGKIHPAFNAKSESRFIRNGVGVPAPGTVVFAISDVPVNFYEFATLFRDILQCPDALYLDGLISSLYAAEQKRIDQKADLGPIIGITQK